MTEQDKKEPTLLESLKQKAKRMLGLEAEEGSTADRVAKGAEQLQKVVKKSRGPEKDEDGLLAGDSRSVIHENVRQLKAKGMSEAEAIKRAHAAAARKKKEQ